MTNIPEEAKLTPCKQCGQLLSIGQYHPFECCESYEQGKVSEMERVRKILQSESKGKGLPKDWASRILKGKK